jgi:glutamine amidotransferase
MAYLKERNLDKFIKEVKQPLLGICLGMQLLCKHSEENNADCIDVFDVHVKLFPPKEKVPHIGWNTLHDLKTPLFDGLQNPDVYFVHSFYAEQNVHEIATCNYILPFAAALQKDNFYAVQFHPEKSGDAGSKILENFLNL